MRVLFNHHISGAAHVIELMRRTRPDLVVIATHERTDTPIRLVVDRFLPEPTETRSFTSEAYADWLIGVAVTEGAELVIAYRRRDELARFRDQFAAHGVRLLTASDEGTMSLLEKKPALLSRMSNIGVPITPFRIFRGLTEYGMLRAEGDLFPDHPGPLCVKPASGIFGAGFRILRDLLPVETSLSALSTMELPELAFRAILFTLPAAEQMMLMPLLPGPERSVDFACHDGRLLGTVTRVKTNTSQRLYHDPYSEELAGLVARNLRLSGLLNLQTMNDAVGVPRLLEVNNRASGGLGMTGLTDVNLPALLLDALEGRVLDAPARVGSEVHAGWREVAWSVETIAAERM